MLGKLLDTAGTAAGALGVVICMLSGLLRLFGVLTLAGSETGTWFVLGIGLIAVGCFVKLQALTARQRE